MAVRVALIDDHRLFREALRTLLGSTEEFLVVAEAGGGEDICSLFEATKPDVVLMDVAMPETDGLSSVRTLVERYPLAKILMLSAYGVPDYVARAFAAGAFGYALKAQASGEVIAALAAVARGDKYLAPELPSSLMVGYARGRRDQAPGQLDGLSHREREIFDLVIRGFPNTSISEKLSISVKTVETHRANINRKLAVHSSAQLLRFAALRGLVSE